MADADRTLGIGLLVCGALSGGASGVLFWVASDQRLWNFGRSSAPASAPSAGSC